jgi:hypothetical protein
VRWTGHCTSTGASTPSDPAGLASRALVPYAAAILDRAGLLDDPDYLQGLSDEERERFNRRNVFAFSLAVAAHQVLQLVGLVAASARVGGIGPQHYAAYPGEMTVTPTRPCEPDCEIAALTAAAVPITPANGGVPGTPADRPGA